MDWRLISYGELDPAFNMAVDEAILNAHLEGEVPPTLRLYGWKPAAISIGYSQKISPEEIRSIKKAGLDVVRRPTGGRAVLHLGDLTYSFVGTSGSNSEQSADPAAAPQAVTSPSSGQQELLSTSVVVAYKQICQGLIEGIKEFGITLELGVSNSDYRTNYDCFRATTNADLHYGGKKMIGSAQLRRKSAVLQHGSILLNQNQNKMAEVFGTKQSETESRHANLFEVLDRTIPMPELQTAIQRGFEKAFAVKLVPSKLTNFELEGVDKLLAKYRVPNG